MIKGIIFDADGVLFDSMSFWENIGNIFLRTKGIEAEKDLNMKLETLSMEEGAQYLSEKYCPNQKPEEILEEIKKILETYYCNQIVLKKGVRECLEQFSKRKIPMVIATSGDKNLTNKALKRLNIDSFFNQVITCTQAGKSKRFPDVYKMAAEQLEKNIELKDIIVFEDSYHALCTAKKAGFQTVGIYDLSNKKERKKIKEIADYIMTEYQDFEEMWKTLNK